MDFANILKLPLKDKWFRDVFLPSLLSILTILNVIEMNISAIRNHKREIVTMSPPSDVMFPINFVFQRVIHSMRIVIVVLKRCINYLNIECIRWYIWNLISLMFLSLFFQLNLKRKVSLTTQSFIQMHVCVCRQCIHLCNYSGLTVKLIDESVEKFKILVYSYQCSVISIMKKMTSLPLFSNWSDAFKISRFGFTIVGKLMVKLLSAFSC